MPITYTGRLVKPGNGEHPSLLDIAVGLSRQPRFAGQTMVWWSVLDHTLFGHELIKRRLERGVPLVAVDDTKARRVVQIAWLLHDAHEALTGDVPSDIKGHDLKSIQTGFDFNIYRAFTGWGCLRPDTAELVKTTDRTALAAEARVLAHHAFPRMIVGETVDEAEAELWQLLSRRWLGVPPLREEQETHPGVVEYLRRITELL
jgi:hypothetical protein